ncbi:hypothetical protein ACFV4S_35615, partial [Streptomyces sp. NPDC059742]
GAGAGGPPRVVGAAGGGGAPGGGPRRGGAPPRPPAPRARPRGEPEAAEEHYVQALALLERSGASGDLADLCRLLGDLLRRTGRVEAAMDAYRTGLGHRAAPGTTTLGPAPAAPAVRPARVSGSRWVAGPAE